MLEAGLNKLPYSENLIDLTDKDFTLPNTENTLQNIDNDGTSDLLAAIAIRHKGKGGSDNFPVVSLAKSILKYVDNTVGTHNNGLDTMDSYEILKQIDNKLLDHEVGSVKDVDLSQRVARNKQMKLEGDRYLANAELTAGWLQTKLAYIDSLDKVKGWLKSLGAKGIDLPNSKQEVVSDRDSASELTIDHVDNRGPLK